MGDNGIETRYLALPALENAFDISPDVLHARFLTHAPMLGTLAAQRALDDAQIAPSEIDAILVSTCTGYLCPGLTSYLSEQLKLSSKVFPLDLVGQGCVAALPNLRAARTLIDSQHYRRVLSVCVEVCSAAFYFDDDPGVLVSACLFGDGAGALVLGTRPNTERSIEWVSDASILDPSQRDMLRFEQKNGLLRNILSPAVPPVASQHARRLFDSTLAESRMSKSDITGWILHAGGRDVLFQLAKAFALPPEALRWSAEVLQEYGNLSSSSVIFALAAALAGGEKNGFWWMSSFGAGFSCQGAMLRIEE